MQRTVPCYLEAGAKAFEVVEELLATKWNVHAQGPPAAAPLKAGGMPAVDLASPSGREEGIDEEPLCDAKLSALMMGALIVRGRHVGETRGNDAARSFGEVLHWRRALPSVRVVASRELVASQTVRWGLCGEAASGGLWNAGSLRIALQWIVRKRLFT